MTRSSEHLKTNPLQFLHAKDSSFLWALQVSNEMGLGSGSAGGSLTGRRDLIEAFGERWRKTHERHDDLSDEENELEDINMHIHSRGFNFLIPIGRVLTQHEEKNDANKETDGSGSEQLESDSGPSLMENNSENDSNQDLDASMEDLDEDIMTDLEDDSNGDILDDLVDDSASI